MSCVVGFTALLLAAKSANKGLLMYSIVILPASLRWENFSTCWASKTSWRSQNWLLWTLKLAAPMLLPTSIAACKAERISNTQPVLVKWCQQGNGKTPKWIFWRKSLQTVRLTPKLRATDLTKPPSSLIFKFIRVPCNFNFLNTSLIEWGSFISRKLVHSLLWLHMSAEDMVLPDMFVKVWGAWKEFPAVLAYGLALMGGEVVCVGISVCEHLVTLITLGGGLSYLRKPTTVACE